MNITDDVQNVRDRVLSKRNWHQRMLAADPKHADDIALLTSVLDVLPLQSTNQLPEPVPIERVSPCRECGHPFALHCPADVEMFLRCHAPDCQCGDYEPSEVPPLASLSK